MTYGIVNRYEDAGIVHYRDALCTEGGSPVERRGVGWGVVQASPPHPLARKYFGYLLIRQVNLMLRGTIF